MKLSNLENIFTVTTLWSITQGIIVTTDAVTLISGYYFKQNKGNLNTWTADNKLFVRWHDNNKIEAGGLDTAAECLYTQKE